LLLSGEVLLPALLSQLGGVILVAVPWLLVNTVLAARSTSTGLDQGSWGSALALDFTMASLLLGFKSNVKT
jgi:hypothetical protein